MTTTEFVKALRERGEVRFDSAGVSILEARIGSIAFPLAEALTAAVGAESSINGGYQTEHFEDDFSGEQVWWLVLDAELLKVWITMIGEPGNRTGADVHLRFCSLRDSTPPEAVFTYGPARGSIGQVVLREVKCRIPVGDSEQLELQAKRGDAVALQLFLSAVQAARQRALGSTYSGANRA